MSIDNILATKSLRATTESTERGELSLFLATPAGSDPSLTYRDALEAIQDAERLGYACAWVAEAHFNTNIAIPMALSFLAAASQVTESIRLGTAVIPLAFDSPLRLAENAAVVNALCDQRLEFGVGKGNPRGFSTDAYNAFGLDEGDRDQIFARALKAFKATVRGPVRSGEKEVSIYPPALDLLDRIWQATGDHATAAAAGRSGDGLMLFRTTAEGVAGDVQSPLIDSYLADFDNSHGAPRVGVSRSLLLAESRSDAVRLAAADFSNRPENHPFGPQSTDPDAVEQHLIKHDVAFGSVEDIVEALNNDATVARSTHYLFNLPFSPTASGDHLESLEAIATEVYPQLRRRGW
jgi:alkanesulfonate monooxygenase SsuD/methylene tetrahydromethanopterin reductase-like flavin-dependent oxidoreductase (luciferase family)